MLTILLINQKFGTTHTYTRQDVLHKGEELNIVNRAGEAKVPKMAGALVVRLPTASALFPVVKDTHARIKEASNLWLIPLICTPIRDFHDRSALNLVRTKHANLYANDGLNFR
jgi:hypothetical protein